MNKKIHMVLVDSSRLLGLGLKSRTQNGILKGQNVREWDGKGYDGFGMKYDEQMRVVDTIDDFVIMGICLC